MHSAKTSMDCKVKQRRFRSFKAAISSLSERESVFPFRRRHWAKAVESTLLEIQSISSRRGDDHRSQFLTQSESFKRVSTVLSAMNRFKSEVRIQSVCCRAISNLSMQTAMAKRIATKGGFQRIRRAMLQFEGNAKLCWLGCSAIWNLSRPQSNRLLLGEPAVELMLSMMQRHRGNELVVNTAFGALSNLSVCGPLKSVIAEEANLDFLCSLMAEYLERRSLKVMMSGAGLINNLAINADHADLMLRGGSCSVNRMMLDLLQWTADDADAESEESHLTLHRNASSALRNLADCDQFLDDFMANRGIERLFLFIEHCKSQRITDFLKMCLHDIGVNADFATTSFHFCAWNGRLSVLRALLAEQPHFDLDAADSTDWTVMDYAMASKEMHVLLFAVKCGANRHHFQLSGPHSQFTETETIDIRSAIESGKAILNDAKQANRTALKNTLPSFPEDICNFLATFNSNIDMLHGVGQF